MVKEWAAERKVKERAWQVTRKCVTHGKGVVST